MPQPQKNGHTLQAPLPGGKCAGGDRTEALGECKRAVAPSRRRVAHRKTGVLRDASGPRPPDPSAATRAAGRPLQRRQERRGSRRGASLCAPRRGTPAALRPRAGDWKSRSRSGRREREDCISSSQSRRPTAWGCPTSGRNKHTASGSSIGSRRFRHRRVFKSRYPQNHRHRLWTAGDIERHAPFPVRGAGSEFAQTQALRARDARDDRSDARVGDRRPGGSLPAGERADQDGGEDRVRPDLHVAGSAGREP